MPSIKDIIQNRSKVVEHLKSQGIKGTDEELVSQYASEYPDFAKSLTLPDISPTKSFVRGLGAGATGEIMSKVAPSVFGTPEDLLAAEAVNPRAYLAGDIAGSVAQTLPLMMIPGIGEAKAAQLLSKVPRIAKTTGLTAKTLPMVQKVAQASTISGGLRGAGTTEEGADIGQYGENILGGALREGTLGTILGAPATSRTAKALKTGLVSYGLGSAFLEPEVDSNLIGLGALGAAGSRFVPATLSPSFYGKLAVGSLGKAATGGTSKNLLARISGIKDKEQFSQIAKDSNAIDKILKDIETTPIAEKHKILYDRLDDLAIANKNRLAMAETAVANIKESAPKERAQKIADKTKDVLEKINNIFLENRNPASKASADATRQMEAIYMKYPEIATQGNALSISNLNNVINEKISNLMVGKAKPSSSNSRKAIALLKNIKEQLGETQAPEYRNIFLPNKPPDKLPVESYIKIKNDIAASLENFKPNERKVTASQKSLLDVKDIIDKNLKANMALIEDPADRQAFELASKASREFARKAAISGNIFSPESVESTLSSLMKQNITQDLSTLQKNRLAALETASKLSGKPGITQDILSLREAVAKPVDLSIPTEIQSQLAQAQEMKKILKPETLTMKLTKPTQEYVPETKNLPKIEKFREDLFKQTGDPMYEKPLAADIDELKTRRFLGASTNRGSDISNFFVNTAGTAGAVVAGEPGRFAGNILGRALSDDATEGGTFALKTLKKGFDAQKTLQDFIAGNPKVAQTPAQRYVPDAIKNMSPKNFAIFNYLMGTRSLDYRKKTGLAEEGK